jgi:uncharacterized protein YecE (DUF72 family)
VGSQQAAPLVVRGCTVYVGVASWTDPTITARGVFYPDDARSAEGRLRYYSSQFPLVEVDTTFYALPARQTAVNWADRSTPGFVFDIKANALMTGHASEVARLPIELRDSLPSSLAGERRVYAKDLPSELDDEVWRIFRDALEPLHGSGKLGAVFLQYAPWVVPTRDSPAMLERVRERLGDIPIAVEFRNAAWLSDRLRGRTWDLLAKLGLSYTMVDEPQGTPTSIPPLLHVTRRELAVIRLHGQRADTWAKRGVPAVEKYRYLYSDAELDLWAGHVVDLAKTTERLHVVFNNCYANYGVTNAAELIAKLTRQRVKKD